MQSLFDSRRYLIPFRARLLPQIFCDTLIIGTGVGGLRAGLAASEHGEVIVLTKSNVEHSSTAMAQGGVAASCNDLDQAEAIESHVQDTIQTGCGLSNENVARLVIGAACERVEELRSWGMRFDLDENGQPARTREGGHQRHRVLHAGGDATGREIVRCLGGRVQSTPTIRVFDSCFALDLLTLPNGNGGQVLGAITYHPKYGLQVIWAWATIMATGGVGQVYRETTNPTVCTGDGLAMAYRAGVEIADMAFIQFHPTTLYIAGSERSLISEAVRGEGAYLVDRRGDRFMVDRHEMAELAPRDVVSRSIHEHLIETGGTHVFLDARHFKPGYFPTRFPSITNKLSQFGIDPECDLIPVHPSAHYTIGGIWTDQWGRTNLPGLYACGEAACTELHGGNRLASNSLLEGLVFGERAGRACAESRENNGQPADIGDTEARPGQPQLSKRIISDIPLSERGQIDLKDVRSSLRSVMWRHLGIVRSSRTMDDVHEMIEFWARYTLDKIFDDPEGWEIQNLLYVASLICNSATWRQESRGTHANREYPHPVEAFRCHDIWKHGSNEPCQLQSINSTESQSSA